MDLKNFFFERLPYYYKDHDTYKDGNDRGILERFLGCLGIEVQDEVMDKLHELIDQLDPNTATNKFLPLLANTVGDPSNPIGTEDGLRERILQAVSLYKIKGTVRSYQLLFNILGYNARIEELIPPNTIYDTGINYDDDLNYDTDYCRLGCIEYNLYYTDDDRESIGPIEPDMIQTIIAVIKRDLEPINSKLVNLIYETN